MRNYIQTFWMVIHASLDDGVNPPIEFDFKPFGADLDQLAVSAQKLKQNVIDTSPGFTCTFTNRLDPFPAWFLFDKANVVKMMDVIRDFFFDQCIMDPANNYAPIEPANQLLRVQITDSPRSTGWTDSDGEKRAPTPSDEGKTTQSGNVQTNLLTVLADYAAALRASGQARNASIVDFAYQQVINQIWSLTEAFAYLRDNNL